MYVHCLDGFPRRSLDATPSGINKFDALESPDFQLVQGCTKRFATQTPSGVAGSTLRLSRM